MSDRLLGVILLFRHGDRQGFYQSPVSYTPTDTQITALGENQEYQLGQLIRSRYLDPTSATAIDNVSFPLIDNSQIDISADAGGEGSVIYDSAVAFTQGAWPATASSNTTLANGTTIVSPLGGYQYVSIESVEPEDDFSLEGWTDCPAYTADNQKWYSSATFQAKAQQAQPFLQSIASSVGGRNVSLENMWNIFDYINVNYIHNATFLADTPASVREEARALANWHEYYSFSDPEPGAVGNIAGRAILPTVLDAIGDIRNASNPLKMRGLAISYKPFISLFNMTGVAQTYPQLAGVVDYAAAMALEVRQGSGSNDYTVTMNFKNGTNDADFTSYNLFGSNDAAYPLDDFVSTLEPYGITSLGQWCNECGNTDSRGCGLVADYNTTTTYRGPGSTIGRQHTSPLAAGFIGAVVALLLVVAALTMAWRLGMLVIGKRGTRQRLRGARVQEGHMLGRMDRKDSWQAL